MLLLCTSGRASELHVCFSIDNSFSATYSFRKHISYAPSSYESVISQSSAELSLSYPNTITLGVITFASATSHENALYCALLDLLTVSMAVGMQDITSEEAGHDITAGLNRYLSFLNASI